ncbi:MAG: hypothetical protein DHS20C18_42790 [Saprospiraceae bacterium]|nr:MAG: hypothetical protein DHS20C18_42790 [Saprospiraceae bacterium]
MAGFFYWPGIFKKNIANNKTFTYIRIVARKKKDILVQGKKITLISSDSDYLSLTDIDAAFEDGGSHIENWMRNRNTVEFLGV